MYEYRTVEQLNENEKDELRGVLFYHDQSGTEYYDFLSDGSKEIVDSSAWIDDIPDSVLFEAFDGIDFVEEDFFCNIKDSDYECCGAVYA